MSATKTISTVVVTLLLAASGATAQDDPSRALDGAANLLAGHYNGHQAGGAGAFAGFVNRAAAGLARAPHTDARSQRRAALIIEATLRDSGPGPLLGIAEGLALMNPRERSDLGEAFSLVHSAVGGSRNVGPLSFSSSQEFQAWYTRLTRAFQTTRALVIGAGRKGHVLPAHALRTGLEVAVERHARRQVLIAGRPAFALGRFVAPIHNAELSAAPATAPNRLGTSIATPTRGIANRIPR